MIGIHRFPTLIVRNSNGNRIVHTGYHSPHDLNVITGVSTATSVGKDVSLEEV